MRTLATQLLATSIAILLAASWADAVSCDSLCEHNLDSCAEYGLMKPKTCTDYNLTSSSFGCCETDSDLVVAVVCGSVAAVMLLAAVVPCFCGLPFAFGLFSCCRESCNETCACSACCNSCQCLGVGCCRASAAAPVAVVASSSSSNPNASTKQESVIVTTTNNNNNNNNQQQHSTRFSPPRQQSQPQPQPQPLLPPHRPAQKNTTSSPPPAAPTGRLLRDAFVTHEYQGALRVAASFKPTKSCKDYLLEDCAPILSKVKQLAFIVEDCCEIADARLAKAAVAPHLFPQLTPDEALALAVYTYDLGVALDDGEENFFEAFSHLLLERNPGTMRELGGYLYYFVHALQKMPLVKNNTLAYRGVDGDAYDAIMTTYRAGVSLHWSQFTSTSTDPTVAKQFAARKTADGKPGILFVISVVAGHSVASHSAFANEQEVILDANAALVVTQPPALDPETGIVTCKLQQTSGAKIIR